MRGTLFAPKQREKSRRSRPNQPSLVPTFTQAVRTANGRWRTSGTHMPGRMPETKTGTRSVRSHAQGKTYDWKGYSFQRVAVEGDMNSANIREACAAAKMRPLCDHSSYSDGICKAAGANWHFSIRPTPRNTEWTTNFLQLLVCIECKITQLVEQRCEYTRLVETRQRQERG